MAEGTIKKGVSAIVYDHNGSYYFLIMHNFAHQGWELLKGDLKEGEQEEIAVARVIFDKAGVPKFNVLRKVDIGKAFLDPDTKSGLSVHLVEASMNIPVNINKDLYDSYLWTTKDSVRTKLKFDNDKEVFEAVLKELKVK